jgi:hypothetical protein
MQDFEMERLSLMNVGATSPIELFVWDTSQASATPLAKEEQFLAPKLV